MQLFYAPDINSLSYTLSEEESRHAVKVLRLGVGDTMHITDGRGALLTAKIVKADPRGCEVEIVESRMVYDRNYGLTMAVAPTKNSDRFEWFLEKATEVGVDWVVPILCNNSERRVFKPQRAEKVIESAMKQSLKTCCPMLDPLTPVREILERPFNGVKLIAHCRPEGGNDHGEFSYAERIPVTEALVCGQDTLILIGPEGDFTAEELALALTNGFIPITLGESRLRTETAALTAVVATYLKNF
jgi:16S rRNA (uracil1498-N3)-methyltransferase